MARIGRLDTDSSALDVRIRIHTALSRREINDWIFDYLDVGLGDKVLDLGCGTGKQTIPLARLVGRQGGILSVDISEESLEELRKSARMEGLADRIEVVASGLDEFIQACEQWEFDQAIASYSLYYARDSKLVIEGVHSLLSSGGIFFFCGPSKDNNSELKDFIKSLGGATLTAATPASQFMEVGGRNLAAELFSEVTTHRFENPLVFESHDTLVSYWTAHNLHDPSIEGRFRAAAVEYFAENDHFTTIKRVIGVRAVK